MKSVHKLMAELNAKSKTLGKLYTRSTDLDRYQLLFWAHDEKQNICAIVCVCAMPKLKEVVSETDFHQDFTEYQT